MMYQTQKIPEGEEYLDSTSDLSDAINEWLANTPNITIVAINTVFAPGSPNIKQAAIITYTFNAKQPNQ
jgi:hypothetical protein